MNKYILQKELPNTKIGAEFFLLTMDDGSSVYITDGNNWIEMDKTFVENNSDWFKLKEEKIEVIQILYKGNNIHSFMTNIDVNLTEKGTAITKAIEFVINGGGGGCLHPTLEQYKSVGFDLAKDEEDFKILV